MTIMREKAVNRQVICAQEIGPGVFAIKWPERGYYRVAVMTREDALAFITKLRNEEYPDAIVKVNTLDI
jgi:hypothetical protein